MSRNYLLKVPILKQSKKNLDTEIIHYSPRYLWVIPEIRELDSEKILLVRDLNTREEILVVKEGTDISNLNNEKILFTKKDIEIKTKHFDNLRWAKHPYLVGAKFITQNKTIGWSEFHLKEENTKEEIFGLRGPQIGAIYSVLAHWTKSNSKCMVVLPTGTGKTEVMLSLFVKKKIEKLLLIVPSDQLRNQLANKFLTLGLLMDEKFKILPKYSGTPVVCFLRNILKTTKEIDEIFTSAQVIVSTPDAVAGLNEKLLTHFLSKPSYLFIDEAHHVVAKTWKRIVDNFKQRTVLFTATPYREDNKPIEAEIVFEYPLRLAQQNGYFKKINFKPFYEWDRSKENIRLAEEGIKQLKEDVIQKKLDHILMARCYPNRQADDIFKIYQKYSEFNPVLLHNGVENIEQIRNKILSKNDDKPRIIVCVDMLGEGFDLPELKIGVFHYIRRSLTPTLQLVGRFTRNSITSNLGDATFIANLADTNVQKEIDNLYKQDTDWNHVINDLNQNKSEERKEFWDFISGNRNFPTEIPLQSLTPNMSTVLYKVGEKVKLEEFKDYLEELGDFNEIRYEYIAKSNLLVIVTGRNLRIDWAKMDDIHNVKWDLSIFIWDKKNKIVSVNSSIKNEYPSFVKLIAPEAEKLKGENLFRCFHNLKLIKLNRIGLRDINGRLTTYKQSMGSDVEPTLNAITQGGSTKVDIFGKGYENGDLVTIGCSEKGRIWSFRDANLLELKEWCEEVAQKVLNPDIIPNEIFLNYTCITKEIKQRPPIYPILIDWGEDIYNYDRKGNIKIYIDGVEYYIYEFDLELFSPSSEGDIIFQLATTDDDVIQYKWTIDENGYKIVSLSTRNVVIHKTKEYSLEDYLNHYPPIIRFLDGSELSSGNQYVKLRFDGHQYDKSKLILWNWEGVNIKKESQGINKDKSSIQYRVIEKLKEQNHEIIFNDDDSGEAADVIAIKVNEQSNQIDVEFYHCKYSRKKSSGGRIGDVDVLCGQAQKSVKYVKKPFELFTHMLRRKPYTRKNISISRIELGEKSRLEQILEMSKSVYSTNFKIFIVQPGISPKKVSDDQLSLLSVTESFLHTTYQIPFAVICNDQ